MKNKIILLIPFLLILPGCGLKLGKDVPIAQAKVEKGAVDIGCRDFSITVTSGAIKVSGSINKELVSINTYKNKIYPPKADYYEETVYKDGKKKIAWRTRKKEWRDYLFSFGGGAGTTVGGLGGIWGLLYLIKIIFFKKR